MTKAQRKIKYISKLQQQKNKGYLFNNITDANKFIKTQKKKGK